MGMWQNYFLESDSNTKEIDSRKKTRILSQTLLFSRHQEIQKIKLFKYFIEKEKK